MAGAEPVFSRPAVDLISGGVCVRTGETTSICLLGPDGTGKSILALHLAASYARDCVALRERNQPALLFASTDLRYSKALGLWTGFGLHYHPHLVPFSDAQQEIRLNEPIALTEYAPVARADRRLSGTAPAAIPFPDRRINSGAQTLPALADYLRGERRGFEVALINLQSATAGDDWAFLNRVVALLPPLTHTSMPHMLLIDAVEGLETMVGELDAFGQRRTRRSRIAQLIRTASPKCHLVLVGEELPGDRLPEEFVTDVVIRLRNRNGGGYARRTVEIVKARGQAHVRGEHTYVIRDGKGSTTGATENPDDPRLSISTGAAYQSYIYAFHSLDTRYRSYMCQRTVTAKPSSRIRAQFGVRFLDELVDGGLLEGTVTALVGAEGTYKSRLGRAFLSQCFASMPDGKEIRPGIAVLLTTQDLTTPRAAYQIAEHLVNLRGLIPSETDRQIEELAQHIERSRRLIHRRFEIHHASPALLFHIIEHACAAAITRLTQMDPVRQEVARVLEVQDRDLDAAPNASKSPPLFYAARGRIRVVIDDWSIIQRIYADAAADPLFLPFLLFYLRRLNVTALVIDSRPGKWTGGFHDADRDLPMQVERRLYTWRLPFFGEECTAIRAVPPVADRHPTSVRELRPEAGNHSERLEVDPHFEMYQEVEEGLPRRVPLRIRFYSALAANDPYWAASDELMQGLFATELGISSAPSKRDRILRVEEFTRYDSFRDFCQAQGVARLDHTLVLQIDEFWSRTRSQLAPLDHYLSAHTFDSTDSSALIHDPFRVFSHRAGTTISSSSERRSGFTVGDTVTGDRVPYIWDFGFLMCAQSAWEEAGARVIEVDGGYIPIKRIWDQLRKAPATPHHLGNSPASVSWREFLAACVEVGRGRTGDTNEECIFDVDMSATETMSCLFLEVWLSEIYKRDRSAKVHESVKHRCGDPRSCSSGARASADPPVRLSLADLVACHRVELYRTWLLLGEVLHSMNFGIRSLSFEARRASAGAIAARHWYSTASLPTEGESAMDDRVPVRLPGHYTVRGDWDLAIAKGSLSTRLGERAIDLLSSRRANIARIRKGIGLPTRDIMRVKTGQVWTTLTVPYCGRRRRLFYTDICHIGAGGKPRSRDFFWLWRSALLNYDRHARFWQIWLCWMMEGWKEIMLKPDSGNCNGFQLYDRLASNHRIDSGDGFREFERRCDYLFHALAQASLP